MDSEGSLWIPSEDLIQGLDNEVFLYHIYSRLSPHDRAVTSCLNKDWTKVHRHLIRHTKLADFVLCGRKMNCIPRLPSLIIFSQDYYRVSQRSKPHPSSFFFTEQFFFDKNDRINSPRLQAHSFSGFPPQAITRADHGIICAVGSSIIAIDNGMENGTDAFAGHLESSNLWRWIRTSPPPPPPEVPNLPISSRCCHPHVVVVGGLVIKLRMVVDDESRCMAHGSYYHPHSKQWSCLTSLYWPHDAGNPPWLKYVFQWNNKMFVVGHRDGVHGIRYVCTSYNFETRTWSPWNGTPELLLLADAVRALEGISDMSYEIVFLGAADGTLFAVAWCVNYLNFAYFLEIDENGSGDYEWVSRRIPPLKRRYNTQLWPLEGNGGIALVTETEERSRSEEFVWWFLNKSGVYARGSFLKTCAHRYNRIQYALIHADI